MIDQNQYDALMEAVAELNVKASGLEALVVQLFCKIVAEAADSVQDLEEVDEVDDDVDADLASELHASLIQINPDLPANVVKAAAGYMEGVLNAVARRLNKESEIARKAAGESKNELQ